MADREIQEMTESNVLRVCELLVTPATDATTQLQQALAGAAGSRNVREYTRALRRIQAARDELERALDVLLSDGDEATPSVVR